MSTTTKTVGYPPHRVTTFRTNVNPNGVTLTEWTAECGASGVTAGTSPFKPAGQHRRLELCVGCFPGRDAKRYFPEPVEITDPDARVAFP